MRELILQELKENADAFVSGESLSNRLGVSRTAVWKHIKELKKKGYLIESFPNRGYRLLSVPDLLDEQDISAGLKTEAIGRSIHCFDVLDSTNNYAKKAASGGCPDGTVIIADSQATGRGRLGRTWNSPAGKGIWMSVVLKPSISLEEVQIITIAASVAVTQAIRQTTGISAGIKWPNDILLDGRKVCGILTEMNSEMQRVNYIVLGIGINLNQSQQDFPHDLRDKAVSLRMYALKKGLKAGLLRRGDLIKSTLLELDRVYTGIKKGNIGSIVEEWKKNSVTLGEEVRVITRNYEYEGVAVDITGDGRLIVDCHDGKTREVFSGEVSIRGINQNRGW